MGRTIVRLRQLPIRAFTVLESLLVLMISSFILLALSSSVQATFEQIQAKIFFLEFEHFYQESQKLSVSSQRKLVLEISNQEYAVKRLRTVMLVFQFPKETKHLNLPRSILIRLVVILHSVKFSFKPRKDW